MIEVRSSPDPNSCDEPKWEPENTAFGFHPCSGSAIRAIPLPDPALLELRDICAGYLTRTRLRWLR